MTDYKETLNLPNTGFAMKANLPTKEPEMIEFWKEMDLHEKVSQARKGRENLFYMMVLHMRMERFIWDMLPKKY